MPRDLDTLSRHPLKRYAWCFLPLRFPPRPQASGKSPQSGQFLSNAGKIRNLFVTPNAAKREFFYGMNFEISYATPRFSETKWNLEIRPIIGWRGGRMERLSHRKSRVVLRGCLTANLARVSSFRCGKTGVGNWGDFPDACGRGGNRRGKKHHAFSRRSFFRCGKIPSTISVAPASYGPSTAAGFLSCIAIGQ